jgi:hypothetical protein
MTLQHRLVGEFDLATQVAWIRKLLA